MVKKTPSAGAGERARNLRRNMTDAEQRLWRVLRSRQTEGCRFRRQAPIGGSIADFVCHAARLIVEIDGGQHAESPRDQQRDRALRALGYRVIRIRNNNVIENLNGVLQRLLSELEKSPLTPTLSPQAGRGS